MNISAIYQLFLQHPQITTDTRKCCPDSIFVALKGENFDGNQFAVQALEKGCAYVIGDDPGLPANNRIIQVKNALKTLQDLSNYHRRRFDIPVIAITGTNGKTTTKELTAAVLSSQYNVLYTQGNLNNHIGVPLTLLQLKPEHEVAIIEMGANHPGEIKSLMEIAEPTHGLVTNVGKAHLEGFGSFDGVKNTKGELYDYLIKAQGTVFINKSNPTLIEMFQNRTINSAQPDIVGYGTSPDNDCGVWGTCTPSSLFLQCNWFSASGESRISSALIGDYNLENILAAIVIGCTLNVSVNNINQAIEEYIPQNNRSQLKKAEKNQLIIDTYNANPTSMIAALKNFASLDVSPKMLILGDMKELGETGVQEHQAIVDYIRDHHFDKVLLCGPVFSSLQGVQYTFPENSRLIAYLQENPPKNYFILIKGSRGIQLEEIINYL